LMSSTPLLTSGCTVLAATVPSRLLVAGFDWTTLYGYVNVQQMDLPMAEDTCFPWLKMDVNDSAPMYPTGTSNSDSSAIIIGIRAPSGSVPPVSFDYENYNNYTVTPLPNYEGIIQARVQPVDEASYKSAKAAIGFAGPTAPLEKMSDVGVAFSKAVKILGPAVGSYVKKNASSWLNRAASWVGGLFGTHRMLRQMFCLMEGDHLIEDARRLVGLGIFPPEFVEDLIRLYAWKPRWSPKQIRLDHGDFVFDSKLVTDDSDFESKSGFVATRTFPAFKQVALVSDDDVKDSFDVITPGSTRSRSATRLPPLYWEEIVMVLQPRFLLGRFTLEGFLRSYFST